MKAMKEESDMTEEESQKLGFLGFLDVGFNYQAIANNINDAWKAWYNCLTAETMAAIMFAGKLRRSELFIKNWDDLTQEEQQQVKRTSEKLKHGNDIGI